jgi:hypothetical protein
MDRFGINEPGPPEGVNKKLCESEFATIAQAFVELFELLEEYALSGIPSNITVVPSLRTESSKKS